LRARLSIAKAVQLLKGNSSKWIHQTFDNQRLFEWQEGYGAFSIAVSGIDDTIRYIQSQKEHHEAHSFNDELIAFLDKHGIPMKNGCLIDSFVPNGTCCFLGAFPQDKSLGYFRSPLTGLRLE
jgi:hypothetical protein